MELHSELSWPAYLGAERLFAPGWPMYRLVIEDDEGCSTEVPVERETITIGRADDNYILLDERNVSRHHARVEWRGSRLILDDAGSSYGIRLNGNRLTERVVLQPGDLFHVGCFGITVEQTIEPEEGDPFAETMPPEPEPISMDDEVELEHDTDETPFIKIVTPAPGKSRDGVPAADRAEADSARFEMRTPVLTPLVPLPEDPKSSGFSPRFPIFGLGAALLLSLSANLYLGLREPSPPPPPPRPPAADIVQPDVHDELVRARVYIELRRWEEAVDLLSQVLTKAPLQREADELRNQAVAERRAQTLLGEVRRYVLQGNLQDAALAAAGIAADSLYRAEATSLVQQPISTLLDEAQLELRQGNLMAAQLAIGGVLALDAENLHALRLRMQLHVARRQALREIEAMEQPATAAPTVDGGAGSLEPAFQPPPALEQEGVGSPEPRAIGGAQAAPVPEEIALPAEPAVPAAAAAAGGSGEPGPTAVVPPP
ncbi:MAG: FHA domain-containing protein, partial [Deltaproteobacteria bacterium]|nr:FHA domain-containing protein [Deltaproteobacteria bacterium]